MTTTSSSGRSDNSENGQGKKYLSIENYFTYIPLLAAILFYAFEINFFTLFSLSEHVLFALEVLPVAIIVLFAATFLLRYW
jgi:hypothetical protein